MGKFQQIRKLDNLIQKYVVIFKIMILIRRYEIDFDPFFAGQAAMLPAHRFSYFPPQFRPKSHQITANKRWQTRQINRAAVSILPRYGGG